MLHVAFTDGRIFWRWGRADVVGVFTVHGGEPWGGGQDLYWRRGETHSGERVVDECCKERREGEKI